MSTTSFNEVYSVLKNIPQLIGAQLRAIRVLILHLLRSNLDRFLERLGYTRQLSQTEFLALMDRWNLLLESKRISQLNKK